MRSDDSIVLLLSGLALTVLVGCASDDASGAGTGASRGDSGKPCNVDTSYNPPFDPTKFVAAVDNPLFPLVPGTTLTYVGGEETIEFQVLAEKKQVAGVSATVIHDVVKVNGEIIED